MSTMYIRVRKDGFIYDYNEILAKNIDCEIVTEEIAYPERFVKTDAIAAVRIGQQKRKAVLDLSTENIPEQLPYTPPELAEEAARGFPK